MYLFIEVSQPTLCLCFSRVWLTADSVFVFQPSVTDRQLYVCVSAECYSMFVFQPSVTLCLCFSRVWLTDDSMFVFQPSVTVKADIQCRLLLFSSLFLSLNTDLSRDDDRQDDRLRIPSPAASNTSPQPVSSSTRYLDRQIHCLLFSKTFTSSL